MESNSVTLASNIMDAEKGCTSGLQLAELKKSDKGHVSF